jgi:flagellar protein FlaG
MNIVVDQSSVNSATASLARVPVSAALSNAAPASAVPASAAPASSMTPQALQAAKAQDRLTPSRQPVNVPSPRPQLPTDAEKMVQQYEQVVDQLNRQMLADDRNLRFGVDRRINTFVITVTDKLSGDVVRQIPPEAVVRVAHAIEDLKGVLYNAEA